MAAIKAIGGVEEQIQVEIDEKKLAELGIPITEVTQALGQENLNQAAGSLYDLDANYLVRMLNQFESVDEIRQIVVRNQAGRRIVLGDLARVWRGARERSIIARLNGQPSVELAIYKEGDANTVTVAEAVQARLDWLEEKELLDESTGYEVVFNQADFIRQSVNNVLSAALLGGLLATVVLFFFLRDLRATLTIGFSIPISIMATFALMYQTDISLNIMSLGGVALGVGMLVDNSIVVLESIHRHRQKARTLFDEVYQGTREVGMAVTASTLTTVAVFLPLIFVEGIAGQLFKDQALTITYSLLGSLLVALSVIPMISALSSSSRDLESPEPESEPGTPVEPSSFWSRLGGWAVSAARFVFVDLVTVVLSDVRRLSKALGRTALWALDPVLNKFQSGFEAVASSYQGGLVWVLDNKVIVVLGILTLVLTAGTASLQLGAELIPPLTQGEFSFEIRLPEGRPLEVTNSVLKELETRVADYPEVRTVFSSVGGSTRNQFAREAQEENFGQMYVVMKARDQSAEKRVIDQIRADLANFPEVRYTFNRPTLFSFRTPIEVEVYAFDLAVLEQVATRVAGELAGIEGLSDVQTTTEEGTPELQVRFDREKLSRLGLDESRISNVLRNKIRGEVATRYREAGRQIEVLVRSAESDRQSIEDIRNLVVNEASSNGGGQREGADSEAPTGIRSVVPLMSVHVWLLPLGTWENGQNERTHEN